MVLEQGVILKNVGISSVEMVARNLVDGGLTNIFRMYQYKWMIYQKNVSYKYTYTLAYVRLDDVYVNKTHTNSTKLG